MRINEIRNIFPILKRDAKAIYLDEGTNVSFVDDAASALITVSNKRNSIKVPGLIETAVQGFTKRQNVIILLPLKKNNILIICRQQKQRAVDYVIQPSYKPIGNPNPFMFPRDLSFFYGEKVSSKEEPNNEGLVIE